METPSTANEPGMINGVMISYDEALASKNKYQYPAHLVRSFALAEVHGEDWTTLPISERMGLPLRYKVVKGAGAMNKALHVLIIADQEIITADAPEGDVFFARSDGQDLEVKQMKAVESFVLKTIGMKDLQFSSDFAINMEVNFGTELSGATAEAFSTFLDSYVEENAPMRLRCGACGRKEADNASEDTLMKCGACQQARYCNKDCQKNDWKDHKEWCKWLKANA